MTDAEKQLIDRIEAAGYPLTAQSIRELLADLENRDAYAGHKNPGADLFAGNAGYTPEQARYAYEQALKTPLPTDVFQALADNPPEAPETAIAGDSTCFDPSASIMRPKSAKWIKSDGSPMYPEFTEEAKGHG